MKKTIMVHIDGIPTHPFEELGMRTVLQAAQTPHLDDLARPDRAAERRTAHLGGLGGGRRAAAGRGLLFQSYRHSGL